MKRPIKITLIAIASLVALLALILALMATFDWNRAKPLLIDKMQAATERSFAINGDLTMKWQRPPHDVTGWRSLIPWPHLRAKDVVLGNPDWATTGPDMAKIRQVDFTVSPLALLHKTLAVRSLVLTEPDLVLEQGKGDRANWQFPKHDEQNKSDWQFEIRDLGLEQGRVRYVDPAKKADFTTEIATRPDGSVKWRSAGHFNQEPLSGHGSAGAILSLQASDVRYPVQADVKIGSTTIKVDGTLTNPAHASALDVNLKILGASMADLFPFSGVLLPETPKFSTEGRLAGNLKPGAIHLRYQNFKGKVGASDLGGTLEYMQKQPRSELRGDVVSHYLDLKDLRAVIGADSSAKKNASSVQQPPDKILPVSPFKTDRWKTMDMQVQFTGEKIVQSEQLPIDHLLARIRMDAGVLSLTPLNFGIAGGRLTTEVHIDGRTDPPKARMKISARGLKLNEMFPNIQSMHASVGQLHGDAALSGTGNSIAALLGSSNGEVNAVITQGSVSKLILEAMGLNIGGTVTAMLFGDRQVQLNCMVADLGVKDGLMHTRAFTVDTSDALIDVDGDINLAAEKLALKIYTDTKGTRLLSLRSPLHVEGTFKKPDVGVDKGRVAAKAAAATALGVVAAPVAALLALVQPQAEQKSPCAELMARAAKKPVAPPPGRTAASER
jgi:AsmA family protein